MRKYIWASPFVLAAVLALQFAVSNGHASARFEFAPSLTRVVQEQTGRADARVFCGLKMLGTAGLAEKATGHIWLANDICAALRSAPKVIEPPYPKSSSGFAVFTLAHEAGHLVQSTDGLVAEAEADCYAARTWRKFALAVGFPRVALPVLRKQTLGDCWR